MKSNRPVCMATLIWSGHASVPLPPDAAAVVLVPISSAAVEVYRPKFRTSAGDLELEAYALRQWKADTTADTHIDIVYQDLTGRKQAEEHTNFSPRSLPRDLKKPEPHGYFRIRVRIPRAHRRLKCGRMTAPTSTDD